MPDISMCANRGCPSFEYCYRAQAKPNDNQSYHSFDNGDKDKCEDLIGAGHDMPAMQ